MKAEIYPNFQIHYNQKSMSVIFYKRNQINKLIFKIKLLINCNHNYIIHKLI